MAPPAGSGFVLVVTTQPLGPALSGPAIRAVEITKALGRAGLPVVLAGLGGGQAPDGGPDVLLVDRARLRRAAAGAAVVIAQGDVLPREAWLAETDVPLVVDLYDPFHLEQLEHSRRLDPAGRRAAVAGAVRSLRTQIRRGDLFLVASPKQRDFWLGHLAALGRVNPSTYDDDPVLRSLVVEVPFGVPAVAPITRGGRPPVLRGVLPGVPADAEIVLWGGGLYDWLDPATLVRAVGLLRAERPLLRCVFLGAGHPNPDVAPMRAERETRELAARLAPDSVVFAAGWVPYADRAGWLADADIGVVTSLEHLETEYAFRTRVLDYLWAGLPVVTTAGDALSALVAAEGAGLTVPPGDPEALAAVLARLLGDPDLAAGCRERSAALAGRFDWDRVVAPLAAYCAAPRRAADLIDPDAVADLAALHGRPVRRGVRTEARAVLRQLRAGGPLLVARRVRARLRR